MTKYRLTHPIKKLKSGKPVEMGVVSFAKLVGILAAALTPIVLGAGCYVKATIHTEIAEFRNAAETEHVKQAADLARLKERVKGLSDDVKELERQNVEALKRRRP